MYKQKYELLTLFYFVYFQMGFTPFSHPFSYYSEACSSRYNPTTGATPGVPTGASWKAMFPTHSNVSCAT